MRWLERYWYRITPLHAVLFPLSLAFRAAVTVRRALYALGIARAARLPVPVVVVGNITVGGTGKTPLTLWLTRFLAEHGRAPGIVTRGYGGALVAPRRVFADSDPFACGDEAVLLARRGGRPVWAGADRAATARALLAAHPECDVVVSDDGLQHYALARAAEIVVLDGARRCGNGLLLPAGPLREPLSRLAAVDALVVNGAPGQEAFGAPGVPADRRFTMTLAGAVFYNLRDPRRKATREQFPRQRLHAVAGIGDPQRFFRHLEGLGLGFLAHPFPDHHAFGPADLAFAECDAVIMTEKDAVKCERFCDEKCWALAVDAQVDPRLGQLILQRLAG